MKEEIKDQKTKKHMSLKIHMFLFCMKLKETVPNSLEQLYVKDKSDPSPNVLYCEIF